ncbi:MAG: OsmC family protein [Pseudomonadota bacterium]
MPQTHNYTAVIRWIGNRGEGTANYRAYGREHEIAIDGKPVIAGSADPAFLGDPARWNPEDMLLSSISTCHMLWFLHLASDAGWVVESYEDRATAEMQMNSDGSGQFTSAALQPVVTISQGDPGQSDELHHRAHAMCFIARSLNFDVSCNAVVEQV